jgi:hypothetical protein
MSDPHPPMPRGKMLRLLMVGAVLSLALFILLRHLLPDRPAWTTGTLSFALFGVWLNGGLVVHGWRTGAFSAPSAEEDERAAAERLKAEYRHD